VTKVNQLVHIFHKTLIMLNKFNNLRWCGWNYLGFNFP